ncbi:MAG: rRNA maturation RNase YbeY [bacterium]
MAILFFNQDTSYRLQNKRLLRKWIVQVIHMNNKLVGDINIILTNDNFLLAMNKEYLHKDNFTDIIAFNYNTDDLIQGDLYISHQRVGENACKFGVKKDNEMRRVIIHGILHLLGWNDTTEEEKMKMHRQENTYLNLFKDVGSL